MKNRPKKKILLLIGAILAIALLFPKQHSSARCYYSPKYKVINCGGLYCSCKGLYISIKKPLRKDLLLVIRNFTKTCEETKQSYIFEKLKELLEKREFEGYCIGIAECVATSYPIFLRCEEFS